ncbi:MAG: GAF domain-containing sensor histidine kinase [Anaerolineales bacterium]|jgi:signal transduction histidine kinase
MTEEIGNSQEFVELLRTKQGEIAYRWAKKAKALPSSRYQHFSQEEVISWASRGLQAIIATLETDSDQVIEEYISNITFTRLQAGFPIFDVTEGLLLSKEVILPIVQSSFPGDSFEALEAITQLDTCLRRMIHRFEQLFSEIMHHQLLEETDKRLAESESLQRTTTALLQKLTLDEGLEIVCSEAQKLTGAAGSAVLLKEDEGWLRVAISTGEPLPALERLPVEDSLAGRVIQNGAPSLVNDPANQVQAYYRNPDLQALLVVPLRVEDISIGVIDVVNKPDGFTEEDIRIISLFADQAAIAIENTRLHQQAEQLAVVEERQRLARELHDSVTQSLYSVTLYADATRMALEADNMGVASENLNELHNMAREAMLDMRLLIFELHPPILEKEGLVAAIQTRLESVEARSGVKADFTVEGERRLPLYIEAELYRIAQEALNNVVKHAKAEFVGIDFQFHENYFRMKIWDNGVGFDPTSAAQSGGIGLRGIEERVQSINGKFFVDSSLGSGTSIIVEVEE